MTTNRYPAPPPGFVPWQPTCITIEGFRVEQCPNCGAPRTPADRWGYVWGPACFADPAAQAAYEAAAAQHIIFQGALDPVVTVAGVPLLKHPSRVTPGYCMVCNGELWHDAFGHYYYKPTRGQLALALPEVGDASQTAS